jgi:hypothetical protein
VSEYGEATGDRERQGFGVAEASGAKPTMRSLGVDPGRLAWRRSGGAAGADAELGGVEVATVRQGGATWVLVRVSGEEAGRVLVYDEHEWECFLDGVRHGEFDVGG